MFYRGSRYATVPTAEFTGPDGRTVRYTRARFVTAPATDRVHTVREGDRPDLVAHEYLQESERFWLVCDANAVMWPPDLTATPGAVVAVPAAGE